ncbi:hypothetical protein MCEMIEM28_01534 [Burkholderiaceae bacterium]
MQMTCSLVTTKLSLFQSYGAKASMSGPAPSLTLNLYLVCQHLSNIANYYFKAGKTTQNTHFLWF